MLVLDNRFENPKLAAQTLLCCAEKAERSECKDVKARYRNLMASIHSNTHLERKG